MPKIFADELMEFFPSAKGVKRLAEALKKNNHRDVGTCEAPLLANLLSIDTKTHLSPDRPKTNSPWPPIKEHGHRGESDVEISDQEKQRVRDEVEGLDEVGEAQNKAHREASLAGRTKRCPTIGGGQGSATSTLAL
ncbi:hypothetical protein FCV25MIE_28434 [Fagus crenata]